MAIAALVSGQHTWAQGLTYSLFERYLESLRQQSAIPGLSAAIVENGTILWESELGKADIEGNIAPTRYTPYVLGSLSQVLSSALLLDRCVHFSYLQPTDAVVRWSPAFPTPRPRSGSSSPTPRRRALITTTSPAMPDSPA